MNEDRDLWRSLGRIEEGVNQLLTREETQDKRISAVERKVWMFTGASMFVAALSSLKAFFTGH